MINACISASGSSSFCICVRVYVCMCVRVSTPSVCACAYECFPSYRFPESHSLSSRSNKSQEISAQCRRRFWQALLNTRADRSARCCVATHTHMCMHARFFFCEFALKGFTRTRKSPSDLHHQAIAVRKVLQSQPVLTRILGRHRHLHNTAVSHRFRLRPEEDQTKTRHGFSEVLW